ncbi:hypothetical protein BDF19DRAFT_452344 [Syncephalis fuscata]|nr:hypothetical protein BDF19DRAFT_452344 [Syncephalis fuscata]
MPSIDYTNVTETAWMKDAKTFWGIPLHPLGEMNIFDFYMQTPNDLQEQRHRLVGSKFQIVFTIMMLSIVFNNFVISVKMVVERPRILAPWCCLIPAFLGILTGLLIIMVQLGIFFTCRYVLWAIVFGITVVYTCNGLIVLQKTYLILCRQKWVLYVGIPSILLQMPYPFLSIFYTYITLEAETGCVAHYSSFLMWYWFSITIPLNVIFSIIFCRIAFQQYRTYGSDAWKRLARDGIQAMCLAVFCNIFCYFCIEFQVGGVNADLLFPGDWVIVSTILTHHCQNIRRVTNLSHRPKTSYIPGQSQFHIASSAI